MKVQITGTRDCCHNSDLKTVENCDMVNSVTPALKFCVHCGARWRYTKFMDEAGSMDWEYRKESQ